MLNTSLLLGILFFLSSYIAFAFWFYANVTKGLFYDPHSNRKLTFKLVANPINLYCILIINIFGLLYVILMPESLIIRVSYAIQERSLNQKKIVKN